jgi:16S rRNA (cytidine1402-2'-O)-methyltransferase
MREGIKKRNRKEESGLFLVATPIGNLEDISLRALRILKEADIIAAEDTRNSRKLLNRFEIATPLISYHEHNKQRMEQELLARLAAGETIAVISDAGTPGISDPGADIAKAAIAAGFGVFAVPGASAALTALVASGLDCSRFAFEGFLPRLKKERQALLAALRDEERTLIFYEAPHRLLASLRDMAELWPQRLLAIGRELTKLHEEFIRGDAAFCLVHFEAHPPRGEFVIIAEGSEKAPADPPGEQELMRQMSALLREGRSRREAAKQLAELYGLSSKEIYALSLSLERE